jgi:ribosomal protein L32
LRQLGHRQFAAERSGSCGKRRYARRCGVRNSESLEPPKLLGTVCKDCGEYFFPQRLVCAKCLSRRTTEAKVPARGTLYSYTFVHFPLFGSMKMEHIVAAPLSGRVTEVAVRPTDQVTRGQLLAVIEP